MLAGECERCNGPPSLTKEDWDRCWPTIKDLYYHRKTKLPELRQIMHDQHDFHGKERQYKTRFNREKNEHSKRLRIEQYQAMATVANANGSQSVSFKAWRGGCQVTVTTQQIHKELGRCRKRATVSKRPEMSFSTAMALLKAKNVQVELRPTYFPSQDALEPPALVESPASPDGSDSSITAATPTESPVMPANPLKLHAANQPHQKPYLVEHGDGGVSLAGMHASLSQQSLPEGADPWEFYFMGPVADSSGYSMLSACADQFGQLSMDRGLPRPQPPLNEGKQRTIRWAQPFYMDCFATDKTYLQDLNRLKADAIHTLRTTLRVHPENHYILPCLNEVVTVLSTNEKMTQLEEFLRESDRVIEWNSPLVIPFRYALAACVQDSELKRYYASQLRTTNEYMVSKFRKSHPNILVNSYYLAWHLMDDREYGTVIKILEKLLGKAQKTFGGDNLYGGNNLMIVNCMAMLGRAYAETDQHEAACGMYDQALARFYDHPYLKAYRLMIKLRLALSQAKSGNVTWAEAHMEQVIQGRLEVSGYTSEATWSAIETLCEILKAAEKGQAAEALYKHHTHQYSRQQNRQYYLDRKLEVPPDLWDLPDKTLAPWSATLTVRSHSQPHQSRL